MSTAEARRPVWARPTWAWCLYDFGNSAFAVLFPVFFATWYVDGVVLDGTGASRWGWLMSSSMLAVALTAPFFGGIADHSGRRRAMFVLWTVLGIAAVLGFGFVGPGAVWLGFVLGVLANFAFESGVVFYNAWLPEIAPPERQARVSAYGFATGYVGSLVALGVAVALLQLGLFAWVWVALALQWGLAALPAIRHLPAPPAGEMGVLAAGRRGLSETGRTLREVWALKDLRFFLLAYFFYMDAVLTVIHFAAVYAKTEMDFVGGELVALVAVVQVTALIGSLLTAPLAERRGPRFVLGLLLIWWSGVVLLAFFAHERPLFWVAAVLAGLGLGSVQATSRALMARLIPEGHEAEYFGFYALCGKTGAIMGPALFGTVAWISGGSLRPAFLAVVLFFLIGAVLLRKVGVAAGGPNPPAPAL